MQAQQCGFNKEFLIMNAYLDYQSSKPIDPRVFEAMMPYFQDKFGNPSSLHQIGDEATKIMEESRQTIANFINAKKEEIIFTSGATESNNLAFFGFAMRNKEKGNHIIISEIEHISILNITKQLVKLGFTISKVPVDQYGRVYLDKIKDRLTDKTILVSIGYANNEVGTIQPISKIGAFCREKNIMFHTDAVAAEGLLTLDVKRDNIDLMTLSSNDIYGPKGIGVLYIKTGIRLNPTIIGGGQEHGKRSGSENIPGIVGMAKAAEIMQKEMDMEIERLLGYRIKLIKNILEKIPRAYLNGHPEERLPNNVNLRFDGIEGESLLLSLNDKQISVSTGSACSSKTLEPSHTLIALGLIHEEAHGSLELTVGRFNTNNDVEAVIKALPEVVDRLRKLSPLYE
ncbi:MAG: cysteine desulfurase [Candidatus Aminicenantes bacterium]|nr:cysteine desulfurase [Candidatus Aminicenantes bacterium]MBL7082005.1 cysteine desulfurase [Candidatus Aminicenantes bacterium]